MRKKLRTILPKYGIAIAIGALMAYATISLHGYEEAVTAAEKYHILSDAFTIPGVVLMMCGILVLIANEGFFDGVSYAFGYAVKMLIPGARHDHEKYGDYVERKREQGRTKGFGFLFFVGAAYTAIAIVFTVLFYTAS